MRNTADKLNIFQDLFAGRTNVCGTYDPETGRASQVKASVTRRLLLKHLTGRKFYGVYLLLNDRTRAIAVDFDTKNQLPPMEFVSQAKHYGITAYIEISKSKGHHVWVFFEEGGVLAAKARLVTRHILHEIEAPNTEVFPKHDRLDENVPYGNFINTPLFGGLVPKGKTVFVDPMIFEPYPNQWDFLNSVKKHTESVLDDIIEINDLGMKPENEPVSVKTLTKGLNFYSLPPCARIMLQDGVTRNQRCCCFRLAVHFKRLGIPFDGAMALLKNWAQKNKPMDNKRIITEKEIVAQASYAYKRSYNSYGCEREEIKPFCQPECPLNLAKIRSN
jgi:hypothetical protein